MASSTKIHAFVFTYPSQGHITPTMELCYQLIANGLLVTFVSSEYLISHITSNTSTHHRENQQELKMVGFPDGLPSEYPRYPYDYGFHQSCLTLQIPAEKLIEEAISDTQLHVIIISDSFCPWTSQVAHKFHLQWIPLWAGSLCCLSLIYHFPILIQNGYIASKGSKMMEGTEIIDCIPGDLILRVSELPDTFRDGSIPVWFIEFLEDISKTWKDATSILCNSFEELEKDIFQNLRKIISAPIYPIGPLLPHACFSNAKTSMKPIDTIATSTPTPINNYIPTPPPPPTTTTTPNPTSTTSPPTTSMRVGSGNCEEQKKCMEWLNKQREGSIIYIAFGSIATLPPEQLCILAEGIEASGFPFLWVIPNINSLPIPLHSILPEGFLDRCCAQHKEENSHAIGHDDCSLKPPRGMIISWAAQVEVLQHPSIGGFLTHCGWNSTMEAICASVPLIVWPQLAEQSTNAKFIVEDWKVGLRLQLGPDGRYLIPGSTTVCDCITQLFDKEGEGKTIHANMSKFSEDIHKAVLKGGSSHSNLLSFIKTISKK